MVQLRIVKIFKWLNFMLYIFYKRKKTEVGRQGKRRRKKSSNGSQREDADSEQECKRESSAGGACEDPEGPPEKGWRQTTARKGSSAACAATLVHERLFLSPLCGWRGPSWSQDIHSGYRLWPVPSSASAWLPNTATRPHQHTCQSKRDWPVCLGLLLYHNF